jgi:hypothetical protein
VIEAVKANKKKGKGKGKGKGNGNVADTNGAATFVATTPRLSTNQWKFRHKMVSAVTVEQEPTVVGNGHW